MDKPAACPTPADAGSRRDPARICPSVAAGRASAFPACSGPRPESPSPRRRAACPRHPQSLRRRHAVALRSRRAPDMGFAPAPGGVNLLPHRSSSKSRTIIAERRDVQYDLAFRFFVFLAFTPVLAFAQQQPQQRDTVVVTGTFEPMSLEEIDRAVRVLPVRSQSLTVNTLVDLLKLDQIGRA